MTKTPLAAVWALLLLGTIALHSTEARNRDRWGVSDDSGINPAAPGAPQWGAGAYARAAEAGFGWARYWLYWNRLNPSPERFDFSFADAEIGSIEGSGLQVYANLMWAPDWAVQGTPGYRPWSCMDATAHPPKFVPTNPGCDNRRPDTEAWKSFVRQTVRHYGRRIRYWGFWNEPDYPYFWHSNTADSSQNLQDLVTYVLIPGAEAAREANPEVRIVGPEVDNPTALRIVLERDDQYFHQTGRHFLDVISFHYYPLNEVVGDEWNRLDRYNAPGGPLERYRAGRPVWVTETRAHLATVDRLFAGFLARDWIDRVFYHGFKTGRCKDPAENPICQKDWARGTPDDTGLIDLMDVPLDAFARVQSVIAPRPPR
ncbi:MAG TPA: hypothetical protein VFE33_34865 [Thermoanaerobaculia bacterium]|nr:hypothetical protein [Thermoanaerobaculia bacterium]